MNDSQPDFYRYWGKARKQEETQPGDAYHLLPYHCLDVAAVGAYWWDHSLSLRQAFCQTTSLPETQVRAWVLFFIALHDLGKLDVRFQCKALIAWLDLNPEDKEQTLPSHHDCQSFNHGEVGLFWFIDDFLPPISNEFDFLSETVFEHPYQHWMGWMEAVTGHHGHIIKQSDATQPAISPHWHDALERDKAARHQWIESLGEMFLAPVGLSLDDAPPTPSLLLAGFCSISDWLGSRAIDDLFSYRSRSCESLSELTGYFQSRYDYDAAEVMQLSGLLSQPNPYQGVQALLSMGHRPRQLQVLVDEFPITSGLTLIEAPTGSGKTETALAYAWRLIDQGLAESITFALPTQATANAMLERIEKIAGQLFSHPNVILAHANAKFNPQFKAIRQQGHNSQADEEAWAQCCEWLAQSRKRVFLGQIGVCTIDQVLVSVLPIRHRFIRGFGVGRSILIVDEIHAYDAYMNGLLDEVLKQQAKAGRSAILLSATLPSKRRKEILACYDPQAAALSDSKTLPYPLVSWSGTSETRCFDLDHQPMHLPKAYPVYIEPLHCDHLRPDDVLIQRIIAAACEGAQVCMICNLVDMAQEVYTTFAQQVPESVELLLFHARYTLNDRQDKEEDVLKRFGPQPDDVHSRNRGRILIATQVVEQSLDLDFDWLISQLCPADLLFQRLGRLHRHAHHLRPEGFSQSRATVLLPTAPDYEYHGLIYGNTRVMWRTQCRIEAQGNQPLIFPEVYRNWLEPIYAAKVDPEEPEWVTVGADKFADYQLNQRSLVRNMLSFASAKPLADHDDNVRAVTRDGEMSLPVLPYIETAQGRQLLNGQLIEQLGEYEQPEALIRNRVNVPESWRKYLDEADKDEDGMYWIRGHLEQQQWQADKMKQGILLGYHREYGMTKVIPLSQKDLGTIPRL